MGIPPTPVLSNCLNFAFSLSADRFFDLKGGFFVKRENHTYYTEQIVPPLRIGDFACSDSSEQSCFVVVLHRTVRFSGSIARNIYIMFTKDS